MVTDTTMINIFIANLILEWTINSLHLFEVQQPTFHRTTGHTKCTGRKLQHQHGRS